MTERDGYKPALACLIIGLSFLIGCGPQSVVQPQAVAEPLVLAWQTPSKIDIHNATVSEIYDEPITLLAGEYRGVPFVDDGAMRPRVHLISEMMPVGDLTGDGVDERVALFEENSGGTGHFLHIAPFALVDGQLTQLGHALVGDRIEIRSVAVEDQMIVMRTVQAGPTDGACCPTEKNRRVWALQGGQLNEVTTAAEGTMTLADFAGSEWVLTAFDTGVAAPTMPLVTLQFDLLEKRVFGSSGCNKYFGTIESPGPRELSVGPLAGTKRMCPPDFMDVETRFLKALDSADSFTYFLGQMAIGYSDGDGYGLLLFGEKVSTEQ